VFIAETAPRVWWCTVRLPNGTSASIERCGRLVDVDDAVDELLEVIGGEWHAVAMLDAAAIRWWIRDVLDDMVVAA